MKKRILAFTLIFVIVFGNIATASAAVYASDYLAGYGVGLDALGNSKMAVSYDIDGTTLMSKIGVQAIYVDKKVGDDWVRDEIYYAIEYPELYAYNAYGHSGTFYFYGIPGVTYRVTITASARNSSGSDAKDVTSLTCVCV